MSLCFSFDSSPPSPCFSPPQFSSSLHCFCQRLWIDCTLKLSGLHSFSLFISRFLTLFHYLLQSWTEIQKVLSLTLLTQHEKTCVYVCVCVCACTRFNNRCNGHHDNMNRSSVYCVCWSITDRPGDRWETSRLTLTEYAKCLGDLLLILLLNGRHWWVTDPYWYVSKFG